MQRQDQNKCVLSIHIYDILVVVGGKYVPVCMTLLIGLLDGLLTSLPKPLTTPI